MIIKASPSKFGKGIALLWNGISFQLINKFLCESFFSRSKKKLNLKDGLYTFESARSAIYNILCSLGIGSNDEVIVCAFTCDAVTYAVRKTDAKVVYIDVNDDLSMNDYDLLDAITKSTKAVIMQNTFGLIGLKKQTIEKIKQLDIAIIEDCSLSFGSKSENILHGKIGDFSVWSLEVSKTITIGWGGIVEVNNDDLLLTFLSRYKNLHRVSLLSDFRRIFQVWFSLLMMQLKLPGAFLIWYLMYGLRIFRKSNNFSNSYSKSKDKMGLFSEKLFCYIYPYQSEMFQKTNINFMELYDFSKELGLKTIHQSAGNDYIVSPRISILIDSNQIDHLILESEKMGIEIGRWFDVSPPLLGLEDARVFSCANAKKISSKIINIPCHWTIDKEDKALIKELLVFIKEIQ